MKYLGWMMVLVAAASVLVAQPDPAAPVPQSLAGEDSEELPRDDPAAASPALETINRILQADQAAREEDTGLGYDAGERRDPFLSLLSRRARTRIRGPRPEGIPGLLIDDITLKGVFVTPAGGVAQVRASNREASYLLREGDRLYDGEVVLIRFAKNELAEVVFKQGVADPAAIKPFREVVKRITP